MIKILKPLLIVAGIAVVLLGIGFALKSRLQAHSAKPRTVSARRGDLTVSVSETGAIAAADMVNVKSKVAGRILSLPIAEGQYVTTGQLIATIDRTLIDPQIASTEAQLASAKARLTQSIASYRLQVVQTQTAIDQAQAALETSKAHLITVEAGNRPQQIAQEEQAVLRDQIALTDAKRTLARKQQLLASGFIAQQDADTAQVAVDTASASLAAEQQQLDLLKVGARDVDVNEAKAGVDAARVQLSASKQAVVQNAVSRSAIDQAQASVTQTTNDLQQLEVQLADTTILAPSSGIVLKKYKQVNEIVQSATTSFSDTDSTVCVLGSQPMMRVNINEIDLPKVRVGSLVRVTVDALPGAVFPARVDQIAPVSTNTNLDSNSAASDTSGSTISLFPVRIVFARPDPRLRPGMTATAEIISSEQSDIVLAPREGIPFQGSEGDVMVLESSGKQIKRHVRVGRHNDTEIEIVSGIAPGDQIVVSPLNGSGRRKFDIGATPG